MHIDLNLHLSFSAFLPIAFSLTDFLKILDIKSQRDEHQVIVFVAEEMKVEECKPNFGYHTRIW